MSGVRKIIVVFKTHFDLGFTDLPAGVMAAYTGPLFDAVQAVMAATAAEPPGRQYTWTLPAWPLRYLLDHPAVPAATRAAADQLVRAGRLTWHAYPFTTHTAFCGLEDLVRGLQIARDLEERYGRHAGGAKQTDVPGHTWILPTLLVRAGVRLLHLGCNSGSTAPRVPALFFWEGPDGARLLTYYSPDGYGTPLVPPPDWPLDTWLALQQTVDNHGPHQAAELQAMRDEVAAALPDAAVAFGELDDFAAALYANPAQLAALPVVSTDLADTWIHGIGTMPRPVARVRALRGVLAGVESLAALQAPATREADSPVVPPVGRAYEQLLLFGEHTWGLDVKSTLSRVFPTAAFAAARQTAPYRRMEESWRAKAAYVDEAETATAAAVAALRPARPTAAIGIDLYEPLGWGRDGWVEAIPPGADPLPEGPVAIEAATGPAVEGEVRAGRLRYPGTTAALGWYHLTLRPTAAAPPAQAAGNPLLLENAHFRLLADAGRGGLVSLREQATGYEWVPPDAAETFGAYRYDLFSAADIAAFLRAYGRLFQDWFVHDFGKTGYPEDSRRLTGYARDYTIRRADGPGRQTLSLAGGRLAPQANGPAQAPEQTIDVEISIYDDRPLIDLTYTVRGKVATPFSEAAAVVFPLNLARPAFRLGQTGSVIDPARDIAPGANHVLWCVDNWVDASDDRRGLAVIPFDAPLVSLGSLGIYEYAAARVLDSPLIYGHLFNTQWGTNFPQWHEGDFRFRYRLLPHAGDWRTGRVWQAAWEATRPCLVWPAGQVAGPALGLSLGEGLVLLAVKPRRDAPGLLVRVWDALGLARPSTIRCGRPVREARRCDLLEHPGAPLPVTADEAGSVIAFAVAPHAVETIALGLEETDAACRPAGV